MTGQMPGDDRFLSASAKPWHLVPTGTHSDPRTPDPDGARRWNGVHREVSVESDAFDGTCARGRPDGRTAPPRTVHHRDPGRSGSRDGPRQHHADGAGLAIGQYRPWLRPSGRRRARLQAVSYTHLRAHETRHDLV